MTAASWSDEELDALRAYMAAPDMSTRQYGAKVGRSRSAIIGKMRDLRNARKSRAKGVAGANPAADAARHADACLALGGFPALSERRRGDQVFVSLPLVWPEAQCLAAE